MVSTIYTLLPGHYMRVRAFGHHLDTFLRTLATYSDRVMLVRACLGRRLAHCSWLRPRFVVRFAYLLLPMLAHTIVVSVRLVSLPRPRTMEWFPPYLYEGGRPSAIQSKLTIVETSESFPERSAGVSTCTWGELGLSMELPGRELGSGTRNLVLGPCVDEERERPLQGAPTRTRERLVHLLDTLVENSWVVVVIGRLHFYLSLYIPHLLSCNCVLTFLV